MRRCKQQPLPLLQDSRRIPDCFVCTITYAGARNRFHWCCLRLVLTQCAGSLPVEWFSSVSTLSSSMLVLNLNNRLRGSIPQAAGGSFAPMNSDKSNTRGASLTLDPMKTLYGLCGLIPSNMTVLSAQKGQLQGTMPAGPCPGLHPAYISS